MTLAQQTRTRAGKTRAAGRASLARKDAILLPLIFCGTMLLLLAGGEIVTRLLYPQDDAAEPCEVHTPAGDRYKPFCTSHTKVWEGPWITQHFNDCGYRTAESCAPRPPGSLRVVVVGSSTSRGALVNYDDSFAARASAFLSKRCGGLVDFQNLGAEPVDVDRIDRRIPEILALHPSAIVMTIGDFDIAHLKDPPPSAEEEEPFRLTLHSLVNTLRESRLFLVMQYYLYRDPAFQIRSFLLNGDSADYVRSPLSQAWQTRVANFGDLLGRITAQTEPAHVPLLLFYTPGRAQAALAQRTKEPPGVNPFVLQAALRKVADAHGAAFFDPTPAFAAAPDFQALYYLTDGHLTAGGHAALAGTVENALLSQPAFSRCSLTEPNR